MSTHDAIIIGCNPMCDKSFLWRFDGNMKNGKGFHVFGGATSGVILDAMVLFYWGLSSLFVSQLCIVYKISELNTCFVYPSQKAANPVFEL